MESQLGTRVLRKISLRIVPFIMLLYFVPSSTASISASLR